jgi:dethiobiotin synthetase
VRGLFVTGTDTGAGKTVLCAAVTAALRARGVDALALKPVLTGLDEAADGDPSGSRRPADDVALASAAGVAPEQVAIATYGPAVSPHLAAELAGRPIDPPALVAEIGRRSRGREAVVVEGIGGLLVPLAPGFDVRALADALGLPLLIAARPGLGTINHTLLTLEAARRAGLAVLAVVLTPWPERAGEIERSNRETIARLGEVDVLALAEVPAAGPAELARAGASLPLERWL